jgi:D-alanyl-D-alanine carboxypeptidase/D-alanyl-D-alanine-endopeptidase (penicillin-binding protein 4)
MRHGSSEGGIGTRQQMNRRDASRRDERATVRSWRRAGAVRRVMSVLALAGASLGATSPAFAQGALQDDLRRLLNAKSVSPGVIGVCILDGRTGSVLASNNADDGFIPASNMKMLTSAAALWTLGPTFQFRTELVLLGDKLVVRGGGDPALADPEILGRSDPKLTVDDLLGRLASAATKAGVTRVSEIVVDDRVFDRVYVHESWNKDNLHLAYSAQVAGLNFHTNVLSVFARPNPRGVGTAPLFELQPNAGFLRVDASRARTSAKGNNSIWLARGETPNTFVMRGEVRTPSRVPAQVTVDGPSLWTGQLIADRLEDAGVSIPLGAAGGVRLASPEEDLSQGRVLAVISTPIGEVLQRCNSDSENLYAEALFKRMGHEVTKEPGSWTNGATVLRMMLSEHVGPEAAASTAVADGSGLSRLNSVTPRTLAKWLVAAGKEPWAEMYIDSMAKPGTGTLEKRFAGKKLQNEVHAKSGFINEVRSLSGYVVHPESNESLVFTILVNKLPMNSSQPHANARELHEDIVMMLDRELTRRSRVAGVPAGEKVGG